MATDATRVYSTLPPLARRHEGLGELEGMAERHVDLLAEALPRAMASQMSVERS